MNKSARILVLAGSLREGAYSKKLAKCAAEALKQLGAEVDLLDLREVPMPLYDGDLEDAEGLPAGAIAFKERIAAAEGLLIVSPEYNQSIPGTFKNALDWASRGEDDVFEGKVAGLMASSPGGAGGMRMMPHLRQVMTALGVWLLPEQVTLSKAHEAFDESGALKSAYIATQVEKLCSALASEARRRRLEA
ncbi:NAD(P)H-dependent oxidoreductase [bacterium]|nr:NAD(P)H-dependent oxidoreductase [bacterium]